MRTTVKKRLYFLLTAVVIYTAGFQMLPQHIELSGMLADLLPLIIAIFFYFIVLPFLYWRWIIKAGKQKAWKIIVVFSLSSLCARYSFPENIATYFDFILFLRYPIIAVLVIIELYLMVMIVKGLWQARKLSGDPRIHTVEKYKDDDKKLSLALPMSWEPASWYYAIPKFSKSHATAICQLTTKSATRLHWLSLILACVITGSLSYFLLVDWSEITAIIMASLSFYSVIFVTANHRVARHFSIYQHENKLIINNAFWGFLIADINQLEHVESGHWSKALDKEQLMLGNGEYANITIKFMNEQTYLGTMGQFPEPLTKLWLHVDNPDAFVNQLTLAKAQL